MWWCRHCRCKSFWRLRKIESIRKHRVSHIGGSLDQRDLNGVFKDWILSDHPRHLRFREQIPSAILVVNSIERNPNKELGKSYCIEEFYFKMDSPFVLIIPKFHFMSRHIIKSRFIFCSSFIWKFLNFSLFGGIY